LVLTHGVITLTHGVITLTHGVNTLTHGVITSIVLHAKSIACTTCTGNHLICFTRDRSTVFHAEAIYDRIIVERHRFDDDEKMLLL